MLTCLAATAGGAAFTYGAILLVRRRRWSRITNPAASDESRVWLMALERTVSEQIAADLLHPVPPDYEGRMMRAGTIAAGVVHLVADATAERIAAHPKLPW